MKYNEDNIADLFIVKRNFEILLEKILMP